MSKPAEIEGNCMAAPPPAPGKSGWPWGGVAAPCAPPSRPPSQWPRITIVTPSYNQGRYIEETIRSVLLQGYPNLEYIIIDGGSSDNSVEIIKKYEPWLAYWVSEKDRGQSHAINKGFARAAGDILGWLCSDDVLASGALACVGRVAASKKASIVVGASVVTLGPDSLEGRLDRRQPGFADMAYAAKGFPQPSTFWTRDLWETAGPLREDLYFVMDHDLWLRMAPRAESISYIEDVLSYQRTQPDQKSANLNGSGRAYLRQRAEVCCQAALGRGETRIRWAFRVWAARFRKVSFLRWPSELLAPGFHWQALRCVFHRS